MKRLFLLGVVWLTTGSVVADAEPSILEVVRGERDLLLLHTGSPVTVRARLVRAFQDRLLNNAANVERHQSLYRAYDSVRTGLGVDAFMARTDHPEEGQRALARDLQARHARLRRALGQVSGEQVVAELAARAASWHRQDHGGAQAVKALEDALKKLEGIGGGLDALSRDQACKTLEKWIASWSTRDSADTTSNHLRLLERFVRNVPPPKETRATFPATALLEFADRLVSECTDATTPLSERLPSLELLNPQLDRLRDCDVLGERGCGELDRLLKRRLCHTPRFLPREELRADFVQASFGAGRQDVVPVHTALLIGARYLGRSTGSGYDLLGESDFRVSSSLGGASLFYFPRGTILRLDYQLLSKDNKNTRVGTRASVVLGNFGKQEHGVEAKPRLPRMAVRDHVWIHDALSTLKLGFWVRRACWSRDEVIGRLRDYVRARPLSTERREVRAQLEALWEMSNLSESLPAADTLLADPPVEIEKTAPSTFLIRSSAKGGATKLLAGLFTRKDGLIRRHLGEELPSADLVRSLRRNGKIFGFEPGSEEGLLDTTLRPDAAVTTGVCTVIPMKFFEARP